MCTSPHSLLTHGRMGQASFIILKAEKKLFYMQLVLLVGAKLQHVIATLALENAGITGLFDDPRLRLRPRDDLFWFKKPELLLSLIHFVLFQVGYFSTWYDVEKFAFFFSWCCRCLLAKLTVVPCFFCLQNAFELASFFWFWVHS